jgi:hypothetical protein
MILSFCQLHALTERQDHETRLTGTHGQYQRRRGAGGAGSCRRAVIRRAIWDSLRFMASS